MDYISDNKNSFYEIEKLSDFYSNNSIQISRDLYCIDEICERVKTKDIIFDFSIQDNLWNSKQKCELIESVLLNFPLSTLLFFEQKNGKKQIIDGKQRINTLLAFLNNEFKLENLKILQHFNGYCFKDLELRYQSKFRRYKISLFVIEPSTPDNIKIEILNRLNKKSRVLNNQEIRNMVFLGKSTDLLKELSSFKLFKELTDFVDFNKNKNKKNGYYILRFLSFYMLYNDMLDYNYRGNLDDFLAFTMKYLNSCNESTLMYLKDMFRNTIERFYYIIGKDGFRYESKEGVKKRPIDMLLFETLTYIFSKFTSCENELEIKRKTMKLKEEMVNISYLHKNIDSRTSVDFRFVTLPYRWREI